MTRVVGLDLSLTSTGVAVVSTEPTTETYAGVIKSESIGDSLRERMQRLAQIVNAVGEWVTGMPDLVVLEGLAFSRTTGHAAERAGLWWLVVRRLTGSGYPLAVVPPTSRAKYATGSGNAGKDAVLLAVERRYPDAEISGNDEADALVLAAMGARWLGDPVDDVPKKNADALAGVQWPEGWR